MNARLIYLALAVLLLALILLPTILSAQGLTGPIRKPGDYRRSMVVDGLKRTYLVHIPPAWKRDRSLPLVVVLHGGGGDAEKIARLTHFSAEADRRGFVVAYPNGVNNHWNDGRNVRRYRTQRENIDDVGFISTLIDRLASQLNIDLTRVYATGISNGAMMCYRLAFDLADRLAAVAPVCGAMTEELPPPGDTRPIPILAFNGTEDPFVPWAGGGVGLLTKRGTVLPVPATIEFWVKRNNCNPNPEIAAVPTRHEEPGIRVIRESYHAATRSAAEVVFYRIDGGGHTWPGGAERHARFGRRADIDATGIIWEFFARHTRH